MKFKQDLFQKISGQVPLKAHQEKPINFWIVIFQSVPVFIQMIRILSTNSYKLGIKMKKTSNC